MTAKEEILALMKQIPDDLTFDEALERLRSAYATKGGAEKRKASAFREELSDSGPPPLDGQAIRNEIIAIVERLPDDLTVAEAVCETADDLRLFYLIQKDFEDIREGRAIPFEDRDDEPVFHAEVPEIGPISSDDFERMTIKEKLIHTMKRLPDDLTLGWAVYEALERLLLIYKLERSFEQIRNGQGIPHEEVKRILREKWQK